MTANVFILQYKHIILPFVCVLRFPINEALHYDNLNGRIIYIKRKLKLSII